MNITITPNDYAEVTECREEMVQYICDSFLCDNYRSRFHPDHWCSYYVEIINGRGHGFYHDVPTYPGKFKEIRKCEVELAVKLLIKAGYHLYRWDGDNSALYKFDKSPRRNDGQEVSRICDGDWSHNFR